MGKNQHVIAHGAGWAVKAEGESVPAAIFKTQREAWEKAKTMARDGGASALLYDRTGRIRERSLFGKDGRSTEARRSDGKTSPEVRSAPLPVGYIDTPDGREPILTGLITIRGWAFGDHYPVSRIEITIDGRVVARAGLCRPRPDVAQVLQRPDAELSGFEARLDLRRVKGLGAKAVIGALVTFLDGSTAQLGQIEVTLRPPIIRTNPRIEKRPFRQPKEGQSLGTRPIRLLCLERGLGRGGSQLRLQDIVRHLSGLGQFDITVIAPIEGPLRQDFEALGVTVEVVPLPVHDVTSYERALHRLTAWAKNRFDVVLGFTLSGFPAIELASRLGIPSVWRIGEIEALSTVTEWLGQRLDPRVEARADQAFTAASLVLFNSENALDEHRARGVSGRFAVLGSGADATAADAFTGANTRADCRVQLGLKPHDIVLICAGTVWPVKGQALLISALKHVARNYPQLRCVLIGEQAGPYAEAIVHAIERFGLGEVVRFLPFCEDLRLWWRAADAAICCSESESMSASVLEAMSFGLPVLACRVGGMVEIVEDGATGWLCEPNDVAAMIEGLRRVAGASREERESLGTRAEARILADHRRTDALWRMTDVLRHLASGTEPVWLATVDAPPTAPPVGRLLRWLTGWARAGRIVIR